MGIYAWSRLNYINKVQGLLHFILSSKKYLNILYSYIASWKNENEYITSIIYILFYIFSHLSLYLWHALKLPCSYDHGILRTIQRSYVHGLDLSYNLDIILNISSNWIKKQNSHVLLIWWFASFSVAMYHWTARASIAI